MKPPEPLRVGLGEETMGNSVTGGAQREEPEARSTAGRA
jgi:hypothetical protein